jgi:hypothetical protein
LPSSSSFSYFSKKSSRQASEAVANPLMVVVEEDDWLALTAVDEELSFFPFFLSFSTAAFHSLSHSAKSSSRGVLEAELVDSLIVVEQERFVATGKEEA